VTRVDDEWAFSDVWVFAAMAVYGRPCTLLELIAAADQIEHAVPSEVDLSSALGRLAGAGLVRVFEDWTFELTDDGAGLWSEGVRDLRGQLELVQDRLSVVDPGRGTVRLPRGVMDQALEEYRA
jgi:hypothetical protein